MSGEEESKKEWETPPRDKEPVSGWLVAGVLLGTLAVFTFFVVGTWAQLQRRERDLNPAGTFVPPVLGQAEINIVNTSLIQLDTRAWEQREEKQRRLHGYGWVDRERGLVHIPIGEAMEQVVAEQRRRREEGGP